MAGWASRIPGMTAAASIRAVPDTGPASKEWRTAWTQWEAPLEYSSEPGRGTSVIGRVPVAP